MAYRGYWKTYTTTALFLLIVLVSFAQQKGSVIIVQQPNASSRIEFGITRLAGTLQKAGYKVIRSNRNDPGTNERSIVIGELSGGLFGKLALEKTPGKEGYIITSPTKGSIYIAGADASGVLYGCMELAGQVKDMGKLPSTVSITDQPEMVLRGTCIGMQKSYYLPGRSVYEYPYTPGTFPWFYDKKLWTQFLDSLVENRMNSLYLWNGHPFASLVKLKDYPYAVEVDDATFKKNEEIFRFLTTEADKRGIWVIQMFYNIIVSKPFAEKHHIKTQDRERPILPLIADYTRKSIAAFVEKYPNVGLMVCLGEAMEGTGNDDVEWFTKTIIPGVKDGLRALGKKQEPPIVLRAHDTDAPAVMKAALPLYKNLYTEAKFNGEALTTYEPRGQWAELHRTLSRIGTVQIENVHIMANLEPFRYGAIDFIQKSVQGMHTIMEGNGLHLYPQASYWDWPYSADSVKGKRLLQIERDWIWYKAWSRYAWKANRNRADEINYWSNLLASRFGCSSEQGRNILEAYEQSGEIAPKLLRRFGITDGNRQTLTLGMLMTQLINPFRYGLFTLLYESESPVGEMLTEYAEKDWKKEQHIGETPVQIINEVKIHGDRAVAAIEAASKNITNNKAEFERLRNDMYCYRALANHYAQKAEAALYVLRYKYSSQVSDLESALPLLEQSIDSYKKLVSLTKGSYLYANSMQTQQRKIPLRGVNGTFKTWTEVLVPFEQELVHFRNKIDSLKHIIPGTVIRSAPLVNADVRWVNPSANKYTIDNGAKVFADTGFTITAYAKELKGLEGVGFSFRQQAEAPASLTFSSATPVNVLVGFFNSKDPIFLKAPELETNASANDYGQAETKIANAIVIKGLPTVNIHSYSFNAGTNTLKLAKGVCLVLGFVKGDQAIPVYDAGLTEAGVKKEIDWLFE
jgi:hypothetical protein